MKRLLFYVAGCLLALFAATPVLAQDGPWVAVPDSPHSQGGYAIATSIQSPTADVLWSLINLDAGMGYNTTRIMSSTNGGSTWKDTLAFTTKLSVSDLWGVDGQRAWMLKNNTAQPLQYTASGPTGFAAAPAQPVASMQFVRFFSPTTGVLICNGATAANTWLIYRTIDEGNSWQMQATTPILVAGSFAIRCTLLGTDIWIITNKAQLLHSPDAGLTWTIAGTPAQFSQLSFRDTQHGLAYGPKNEFIQGQPLNTPALYRTTDGGATWSLLTPTGTQNWIGMTAAPGSAGTYLTVGRLGNSAFDYFPGTSVTRDDGQTWQELGGKIEMSNVIADQRGNAWASQTSSGKVWRFTGSIFVLATTPPATVTASVYPNPTTGRVQLPAAGAYRQVTVYDAAGRQCRTALLGPAETSLDISSLGAGLYLLRLDGGTAASQQQRLTVVP